LSPRQTWIALLALGLTASFAFAARRASSWTALISMGYPEVKWVDGETLSRWMDGPPDQELVLLDVRTAEEQQVSHLRDAWHLDASKPRIEALTIPEGATVVVYCSIGYRSAAIVEDLKRAGIDNIYNLEGGLFGWANEDRPIYRGTDRVDEVHPFNGVWGLLLRSDQRAEN
jgi:rhodanese-related sulfurtransferase